MGNEQTGPNPETEVTEPALAIQEVLDGNDIFVSGHSGATFEDHLEGQTPFVTLLSCADSRVNQMTFNFDVLGRVFEVRGIGNQAMALAGSIDYGVCHLKTPLLLIMGHVKCGAIKAAMGDYGGLSFEIIEELDKLHLPLRKDDVNEPFDVRWLKNAEYNVDYQTALCVRRYQEKIAAGELAVIGAVYDFANLYGKGFGRTVCVNLNGTQDPAAIKENPLMKNISTSVLDSAIARVTPFGSH